MSAGGLFGYFMNLVVFVAFWTVLGVVFDKIAVLFNMTIRIMPTYQDAVNGFAITQTIYSLLPVIVFIFLSINYLMNENSMASGEV